MGRVLLLRMSRAGASGRVPLPGAWGVLLRVFVCACAPPACGWSVQGLHLQVKPECHQRACSTCGGPCGARGFAGAAQRVMLLS